MSDVECRSIASSVRTKQQCSHEMWRLSCALSPCRARVDAFGCMRTRRPGSGQWKDGSHPWEVKSKSDFPVQTTAEQALATVSATSPCGRVCSGEPTARWTTGSWVRETGHVFRIVHEHTRRSASRTPRRSSRAHLPLAESPIRKTYSGRCHCGRSSSRPNSTSRKIPIAATAPSARPGYGCGSDTGALSAVGRRSRTHRVQVQHAQEPALLLQALRRPAIRCRNGDTHWKDVRRQHRLPGERHGGRALSHPGDLRRRSQRPVCATCALLASVSAW